MKIRRQLFLAFGLYTFLALIPALLAYRASMYLLLPFLLIILVAGAVLSMHLASRIASPIRQLERFTEQVAAGDFSRSIKIDGAAEITSLAEALNLMAIRLRDTMNSLELAVKNLHEKQGQLVEAEKLASLGRLAAGVAHEINNPLAIINEKAGLMQDLLQMSPDFTHKGAFLSQIEGISKSVIRCRSITHRLLGFARRIDVTIETIDLNEAIRETAAFLKSDIVSKSIRLDMDLANDLPPLKSDRIQLEQVFLNLIKNAVDAVAEGGEITVSTAGKEEHGIQVRISDNGPGISRDMLTHIFEPFFTTKERGKGTGLGLFVSRAILTKLGCKIQVDSKIEKGTTFLIDIPLRPSPAREQSA